MHEHGFMTPENIYVHAATLSEDSYHRIAATGGSVSVSTESEQSAGQGYPPTWQLRKHGIPVSLSMDTSVWWSGDLFSAMRTTLGADRSREHIEAHARGETVTHSTLRAEHVVDWATRGGAGGIGRAILSNGAQGATRPVLLGRPESRRLAGRSPPWSGRGTGGARHELVLERQDGIEDERPRPATRRARGTSK